MAIPKLNGNGVLPPHNGDLTSAASIFPYPATTLELCQRFGTTRSRRDILRGYLGLRATMAQLQLAQGWQWVSGDFLDDDRRRSKQPDHIKVVTFCQPIDFDDHQNADLVATICNRKKTLQQFRVDHNPVYLTYGPELLIQHTQYWSENLSHQRDTGIRKGFLKINLNTPSEDNAALSHLDALEAQV